MALRCHIKVSEISNLSDARYCAGMGVDMLGFCLDPTQKKHLDISLYKEFSTWISGVQRVAEFECASPQQIHDVLAQCEVDYIQVNDLSTVKEIVSFNKPIILKQTIEKEDDLLDLSKKIAQVGKQIEYITLSTSSSTLASSINHFVSKEKHPPHLHFLKGYELAPSSPPMGFYGIELTATPEEKTGFKDYGELMDMLEALEVDD